MRLEAVCRERDEKVSILHFLCIGPIGGFVYPLFVVVIECAGVHFCPDVYNDGYLNVLVLLSIFES